MMKEFAWTEIEKNVFQRPCTGQEHAASFNQNIADGHTELSVQLSFETNIEQNELLDRIRLAWQALRISHPECSIELSTDLSDPQMMVYRLLKDEKQIEEWMNETLIFYEIGTNVEEVLEMTYNRRLPTKGKQSMLLYVPANQINTSTSSHHFIWNVSHAVTDAFSITMFLKHLLDEVVFSKPETRKHRYSNDIKLAIRKLPASLRANYTEQCQPTEEDTETSVGVALEQVQLYEKMLPQSIAMHPRPDHAKRNHFTHCLADVISEKESKEIFINLRKQKASMTFASAASTILTVKDMYGTGKEKGALLGMTRNARMFLDTDGLKETSAAIPMATDVVFLWIPFDESMKKIDKRTGKHSIDSLLSLSHSIKKEIGKHLTGPHYMASMQLMSDAFVNHLRENVIGKKEDLDGVKPSPPGFSPQGYIKVKKVWENEGKQIIRGHIRHVGRQVNASPWIGMFTLDEQIHISIGFDEKYYQPEIISKFFQNFKSYLLSLAKTTIEGETETESYTTVISRL